MQKRAQTQAGGGYRVRFPVEVVPEVEAVVVMTADDSPHTMASKVYLSGNATEPIDVHYVGGVPQWLRRGSVPFHGAFVRSNM